MSRDPNVTRLTEPVTARDHALGSPDAPLTLVEYGDFECPYCRKAFPIVHDVRRRMGARLRFVFRHFPLTKIHQHAQHAHEAAEAAAAQGAFWQMHDRLFERQFALDDEHLIEYATELGLDADRLGGELAAGTHRQRVRDDVLSGLKSGVNGTPTFFINGARHNGNYEAETLLAALEQASVAGQGVSSPGGRSSP